MTKLCPLYQADCCFSGIKVGEKLTEGKTKCIYEIPDTAGHVLIQSKDRITAGDGDRAHDMKGKAAISNATNAAIFELLNNAGKKLASFFSASFLGSYNQVCGVGGGRGRQSVDLLN